MSDNNFKRTFGPQPHYQRVLAHQTKFIKPIIIAGTCFVESRELFTKTALFLNNYKNITYLRGGVFRAGTYPPKENFGLNKEMLKDWADFAHGISLKIIVECLDVRDLDFILKYADAVQVGARQGQGYALLNELGKVDIPVALKRGQWMNLDEFLGAAEYLLAGEKCSPFLIERGSVSYHNHVRYEPSITMIAAIKQMTTLPILIDGSHGTGRSDLVLPIIRAGIAAGADGYLIEVHPKPDESLSDSEQAISFEQYAEFTTENR